MLILKQEDCGCWKDTECCAGPYIPHTADCIRQAINDFLDADERSLYAKAGALARLGMLDIDHLYREQDLQLVTEHLLAAWDQRARDIFETGVDKGQAWYWSAFRLDCLVSYVKRVFSLSGERLAALAGFYPPATSQDCLPTVPLAYDAPCGTGVVPAWPGPPVPPDEPCQLPATYMVESIDGTSGITFITTGAHEGEVFNATDGTYVPVADGEIINVNVGEAWWTVCQGSAVPYFPVVNASVGAVTVDLSSAYPCQSLSLPWTCTVSLEVNGIPQIIAANVNSPQLASLLQVSFIVPSGAVVGKVLTTYLIGGCVYGPFEGVAGSSCGITSVDADIIADIGDMVSYTIYPQVDNLAAPTKYGPATIYIKSDVGGVLSGSPSDFEVAYGAAPLFGVGDVVRFEIEVDTFQVTSQVVLAHLPDAINNLADVSLDFSPLPKWNGDPSSYPVAGLYKRNPDNTVSPLFQAYSIAQTQPDEVTLTATAPAEALLSPNSARVEYTVDGTTWVDLGTYTDVALAAGVVLAVDHFATELRTTCLYNDGNCEGPQVTHALTPLILDLVIPFSERAPWGDLTPQRRYLWRSYDRQAWTRTQSPIGGMAMSGAKDLGETLTGSEPLLEYSMAASMHRDTRVAQGFFGSGASGLCFVDNNLVSLLTNDFSDLFTTPNPSPPPSIIPLSPYVTALLPEAILSVSVFAGATGTNPAYCLAAGQNSSLYLVNPIVSAVPLTGLDLSDNEIISCAYMSTDNYLLFMRNNSWRTTDGGATWTEMPLKVGYLSIALDDQTALVMATASDDSKTGLFRTADAGLTWTWINTAVSYGGDTGGFSACSATAVCRGGLKSLDGGLTWAAMNLPSEVTGAHRVLMLSEDIIILATNKVWYSVDGGTTFKTYPFQPPEGTQTYAGIFAALTGWKANH